MNALAPRAASGAVAIPPHLPTPPLPEPVAAYLRALDAYAETRRKFWAATPDDRQRMHVGDAPRPPALTGSAAAEATRLANGMDGQLAPVTLTAIRAWLAPVNAACRNPQTRDDFEARVHGIHALCEDLPHGAFTGDARRALPEFFPSAADVRAAVEPGARKLRATQTALRDAASPRPAPEPEPERERTPEMIAAVRAKAAEARAVLRAAEEPAGIEPVKPRYLSPGQLLAVYERLAAEGSAAAATRAAAIRKQIAAAA
jgi:hypothetical protein